MTVQQFDILAAVLTGVLFGIFAVGVALVVLIQRSREEIGALTARRIEEAIEQGRRYQLLENEVHRVSVVELPTPESTRDTGTGAAPGGVGRTLYGACASASKAVRAHRRAMAQAGGGIKRKW